MSEMKEKIEDLLPFYALDILTDDEKEQVGAVLATNPDVQAELADVEEILSNLALNVPAVAPSAQLKSNLMRRVYDDVKIRAQPVTSPEMLAAPPSGLAGFFKRIWSQPNSGLWPVLVTASLFVALGVGVWAYRLHNEVLQLRGRLTTIDQNFDEKQVPLKDKIDPLAAENNELRQNLAVQGETVATLRSDLTKLQAENDLLQQQIADQRQVLTNLTTQMASLPVDNTQAGTLATVLTELTDQQETLTALDETVTSLTDRIAQLQSINVTLRQELSAQRVAMAQLTAPNVQIMLINGTETLPNAHGHFVANPEDKSALLIVAGLPRLQPGQEYQFWLVQNGTPFRTGTLDVYDDGLGLLLISSPEQIGSFEAMGISIEPAGSSGAPESEMIMLGNLAS